MANIAQYGGNGQGAGVDHSVDPQGWKQSAGSEFNGFWFSGISNISSILGLHLAGSLQLIKVFNANDLHLQNIMNIAPSN
jgi:hypothetical protein